MRVLVAAASKYGSTAQIAETIADTLTDAGVDAVALRAEQVGSLAGFDAVVLGSGVYMGHWLAPARDLAARLQREAAGMPVWLFSSGPLGEPPKPEEESMDVAPLIAATRARGHQVFGGRLVRRRLPFADRAVAAALRVPDSDDRDWASIRAWARGIAQALRGQIASAR